MRKSFLVIAGFVLTMSVIAASSEYDSCTEPNRLTVVCRTMKHLRSHIMVIEAQRDLVQTNFLLLEKTMKSFKQSVVSLLTGSHSHVHLERLETTKVLAEQAFVEAQARDPQAFKTANLIKTTCQQCHNSSSPAGLTYEEIFQPRWGRTAEQCNEAGRNPFVCKNMYALVAAFEVFMTAADNGKIDFEFAEENAKEIQRIVRALQESGGPIHEGGNGPLKEVQATALELEVLARQRSPELLRRAPEALRACVQCHKAP